MNQDDQQACEELRVHGEMTIYRANELAQSLFEALRDQPGDQALDLSGVTEFDTAGLQILLMARRIAEARGDRLDFLHPSECVAEVLQLCNVPASSAAGAAS